MIQFTHRFEMRDSIPQVVIYAYSPVSYEFSTDLGEIRTNAINTAGAIRDYILKHFSNIKDEKAMIILNGVVLGSIVIGDILQKK